MKRLLASLLSFAVIGSVACSTLPSIIYNFQERIYRPCGEQEFKDLFPDAKPENSAGIFCFRYCAKYKIMRAHIGINCVNWQTDVQDLRNYETFKKFRDAGFTLAIPKDM